MEPFEFARALRTRINPGGVLNGLGQQPGEIRVVQGDARPGESGTDRIGVDMALGGLGEVRRRQERWDVPVDDHTADRQIEGLQFPDGLDGLLDRQRFEQRDQMDRCLVGVQQLHHTFGLGVHWSAGRQIGDCLGDVEEATDASGWWRVHDDRVIGGALGGIHPDRGLLDLAGEQHIA